jgi:predicted RNA-binding Zn-ribbon protein involved in translation (DUF1610 family)
MLNSCRPSLPTKHGRRSRHARNATVCDTDANYPEFLRERLPVARKPHRCTACGETIHPGQRYSSVSAKWDGDVEVVKKCLRCLAIYEGLVEQANERDEEAGLIAVALNCGEILEDVEHPMQWLAFALPTDPEVAGGR